MVQIELLCALIFEMALNFTDYIIKSEGIADAFDIVKVVGLSIAN